MKILTEFKNLIPPLEITEKIELEKSIRKEGIRDPLLIWGDILIDGHNRKEIADRLKIKYKTKQIKFKDKDEASLWIITNQLARRNLSAYNRAQLALKKESIISARAKENQKGGQGGILLPQISVKAIDTQKEVAKLAGTSHDTVAKVKFIEKNAPKKMKEELSKGSKTINSAYTILKRQEKVEQIKKEFKTGHKINEDKKYEIVYADPAWDYNRTVGEGIAKEQYKTSSLEEMKNIPINHITEKDSVIFMWVTFPMLESGLELMKAWNFKYKTCAFNWIKLNKDGTPFFGIGHYTKSNSEICLLGVKGNGLPVLSNKISQIIMTQKDIHSKKPEEVRNLIIQLFGDRKKIELFARTTTKGWDVWGNEV